MLIFIFYYYLNTENGKFSGASEEQSVTENKNKNAEIEREIEESNRARKD